MQYLQYYEPTQYKPDNKLVKNVLKAFKIIVINTFNYIFGSNNIKHD